MQTLILKPFIAFLLTFFLITHVEADQDDANAIIEATSQYLKVQTGVTDALVKVHKISGNYACVILTSPSGQTDPAEGYLKKGNGRWKVLIIGTDFSTEDFNDLGIPGSVRN